MSAGKSEAKKIREEVLETRQMSLPFRMPLQAVGSLDKRIRDDHGIDLKEEPKNIEEANRDIEETVSQLTQKNRSLVNEVLRLTREKEAAEKRAIEAEARAAEETKKSKEAEKKAKEAEARAEEEAKKRVEAEKEASIDGLTKLHTKKVFGEHIKFVMDQTIRVKNRVSVVMLDIDHFKNVNDTYGHPVGDKILEKVAGIVQGSLKRDTDYAARYGGEEIVLVLPDTDGKGSFEVAEKIRKAVESGTWIEAENTVTKKIEKFHVTISAGCATFDIAKEITNPSPELKKLNENSDTTNKILNNADTALYSVKRSTRNAVKLFNGEKSPDSAKAEEMGNEGN